MNDFISDVAVDGVTIGANPGGTVGIRWVSSADGALVADMLATDNPAPQRATALEVLLDRLGIFATAKFGFGDGSNLLTLEQDQLLDSPRMRAHVAGRDYTIGDGTGASSFLQLLAKSKAKLNFGAGTVTFPGGSQNSNQLAIAHGLGAVPKFVLGMVKGSSPQPANSTVYESAPADGNHIFLTMLNVIGAPGAGANADLWWVAFG